MTASAQISVVMDAGSLMLPSRPGVSCKPICGAGSTRSSTRWSIPLFGMQWRKTKCLRSICSRTIPAISRS
jgi:hypothetical protein